MRVAYTLRLLGLPLVALLPLLPTGARAGDDVWLAPDPPLLAQGEVRVELLAGGKSRAFARGRDVRLQRIWRSGRQNLSRAEDGTARFRVDAPGTQLVAYADGARFCKAFVIAGRPAEGGQLHLSEVGHRLEIVPQTDPIGLVQGVDTFELQVLFEREPLAFATVEAVHVGSSRSAEDAAASRAATAARTDEIGLAALRLPRVGPWVVRVRTGEGDDMVESTVFVMRGDGW